MTNIDRAAEVLWLPEPHLFTSECDDQARELAQALADAGLLMPDLPEPYTSKFDTSALFTPDEDSEDGAYIDVKVETGRHHHGRITIDLDPCHGSDNGFTLIRAYVSPQWCREAAALMLAAADYAEGHASDRRDLPLHRTEAGYPNCSTCDGGGCPDCTDPA